VRKERAQTELTLQRERERNIKAEATIVDQAAEILRLQQQLEAHTAKYEVDTAALREALEESQEREKYLKELSDEAYELMTMYGVRKV
jgi:alkyl hydroperoxide reductase subunit AhpF